MRSRMFATVGALIALVVMVGAVMVAAPPGQAAAQPLICVAPQILNVAGTACVDPPVVVPPSTSAPTSTPAPGRLCDRFEVFDPRLDRCVRIDRDRGRGLPDRTDTDTTITRDGDCTTVTTTTREYERSLRRWNDLATRYRGERELNDTARRELDGAHRDRIRWAGEYERTRRLVDTDTNSTTTCRTVPPAPVIVVEAAPRTFTVPSQVSRTPVGSAETGTW